MKTWHRKTILGLTLFYLFFMYSPFLMDIRVNHCSNPFPIFTGPLVENNRLSEAGRLFQGILRGPESVEFHEGYMYTGLEDGRIVKIKDEKITTVARTGTNCAIPHEERKCGRPLGLRKGKDCLLYFCDAYYGIFTMNFTTGISCSNVSLKLLLKLMYSYCIFYSRARIMYL
ncbi:Adipocyte plasma membrane-associated protein [Araneus ventricosus]|uniref:Adipocyte plasma membrane-associated protein n=1 Tax=Araneus ventricosus TaxID=182803 RepID=A0A4Y2E869_ARAVE|nr:Adipocyte plasma membrane-associated protein [Araneus ventricosus]